MPRNIDASVALTSKTIHELLGDRSVLNTIS
jgi:hypothetical protein